MKYILRSVIVIAMIIGLVFGIKALTTFKDANQKFAMVVIENDAFNTYQQVNSGFAEIEEIYNKDGVSVQNPTNLILQLKDCEDKIVKFIPELYFAKGVKQTSVKNIEKEIKNIKNELQELDTIQKNIKNISTTANSAVIGNYLKTYNANLKNIVEDYQQFTLNIAKYILEYSYNNNNSYTDLQMVITSLESVVNQTKGENV